MILPFLSQSNSSSPLDSARFFGAWSDASQYLPSEYEMTARLPARRIAQWVRKPHLLIKGKRKVNFSQPLPPKQRCIRHAAAAFEVNSSFSIYVVRGPSVRPASAQSPTPPSPPHLAQESRSIREGPFDTITRSWIVRGGGEGGLRRSESVCSGSSSARCNRNASLSPLSSNPP